jgi:hypothetical protein
MRLVYAFDAKQSRRGHEGSKFHWLERGVYEWSEEMKVGAALIPIVTWNSNTIPRGSILNEKWEYLLSGLLARRKASSYK